MHQRALTLIELLLVISILALLVAAAVPNFTDADIAAQVAQVRKELRSIGTALESYHRDYRAYPPDYQFYQGIWGNPQTSIPDPLLRMLTTPTAYIPRIPNEVFLTSSPLASTQYLYKAKTWISIVGSGAGYPNRGTDRWVLVSNGPDRQSNAGEYMLFGEEVLNKIMPVPAWNIGPGCLYDPTNGAISAGDIVLLHEDMLTTTSAPNWQGYR